MSSPYKIKGLRLLINYCNCRGIEKVLDANEGFKF